MSFDFKKDPFDNFQIVFTEAQTKGIPDANAMSLASVGTDNRPSVRIVLYKGMIRGGFSFFTNYDGRKGQELDKTAQVAATFFWPHLDRQVRIEGVAEKVTREESEKYFATRPRLSQLGAWTSNQSEKIESFPAFQKKLDEISDRFKGQTVPCPPHWGGYRIVPSEIEFWFGKNGRLHERYVYHRSLLSASGKDSKIAQIVDWDRFLRSP